MSNLDTASERALTLAMNEAGTGRATLVIAQCLSTIRAADPRGAGHGRGAYRRLVASQL